jgi:hypothetical protein
MRAFESRGPIQAEIDIGVGQVDLVASDRTDTVVTVSPTNPARPADVSLAAAATVWFEGARLTVTVPRRLNVLGPNASVDVTVELPAGSTCTIEIAYGAVRGRGRLGAAKITASYGAVTLDEVGDLILKAPHGDIEIAKVAGRLDLVSGQGRIRIGHVAGDAVIKGAHGDIDLGRVDGSVEARTSGGVNIDRAAGNVSVKTAYGAARVRSAANGVVRLESGYSSVEVGVPAGVAAWVRATSAHGTVRNELTPDASGGADAAGTLELRLRAQYGDVLIRRAERAA